MDEVFDASGAAPTMDPVRGWTGRDCLKIIRAAHKRLGTEPTQAEIKGSNPLWPLREEGFMVDGRPTGWQDDWKHCDCRECRLRLMRRTEHEARRGVRTRGEKIVRISRREANARLDLGDLGLEQHYLGPSGYRGDICLSVADRSAIMILRPPIAASFNTALCKPLEISRLLRTVDRKAPHLSSFVVPCMRWVRESKPECSCVIAYSDPGEMNVETGKSHSGIVYLGAGFEYVGDAPAAEPYWIDRDGKRRNRQSVYRLLGTASRERVARLRPRWQFVPGERKRLFVYPMAMTVAEVVSALEAQPRSARTRPSPWAIRP